jgi:hypothetical protein
MTQQSNNPLLISVDPISFVIAAMFCKKMCNSVLTSGVGHYNWLVIFSAEVNDLEIFGPNSGHNILFLFMQLFKCGTLKPCLVISPLRFSTPAKIFRTFLKNKREFEEFGTLILATSSRVNSYANMTIQNDPVSQTRSLERE